jgi:hypothetical protein
MRERMDLRTGLKHLDSLALPIGKRAEIAAERAVVKPETDIYPKGLITPTQLLERRRLLGATGYIMGLPKR